MNASVSALARDEEVQTKIRKVRAFGRNARSVCMVLLGFGLVGGVIFLFLGARSDLPARGSGSGGAYDILTSPFSPLQLKLWWLVSLGVTIGIWLAAVLQFYRLFGNLAAGQIYTAENVRRVRSVGLLWLLLAVLNIALPGALVVANILFHTSVQIDLDRVLPSFGELWSPFASAGLVLLVSWIMDVGLYEKERADALRRDADLVI